MKLINPTPEELEAIRSYTGGGVYRDLNERLRTGKPLGRHQSLVHAGLQSIMGKIRPLGAPVPVVRQILLPEKYRTLQAPDTLKRLGDIFSRSPGRTITLGGYTSTHRSNPKMQLQGNPNLLSFRINARHGADIAEHSVLPDENEILLPHNSKFRVAGYENHKGSHTLHLDQLV